MRNKQINVKVKGSFNFKKWETYEILGMNWIDYIIGSASNE